MSETPEAKMKRITASLERINRLTAEMRGQSTKPDEPVNNVISLFGRKPVEKPESAGLDFSATVKANAEKAAKLKAERVKANEAVKRSYRLQPKSGGDK